MMTNNKFKPWHPDRPVSRGATAYHDAVVNAPYYIENLDEMANLIEPFIKNNQVVVDFGAGTGVSALRMLKKLKADFKLILVDNSAAWLGKAHEILSQNPKVQFYLLEKNNERYATLAETIGLQVADHVTCANTIHLIPNVKEALEGINLAMKPKGTFTFQSGNIARPGRREGAIMVDDTIIRVHDISLDLIRKDKRFLKYADGLDSHIKLESSQRKFVFPDPRPEKFYLDALKSAGFRHEKSHYKLIRISYKDWLDFLRVKRLQAGILPEIGGKEPSPDEEKDRDEIITAASQQLFMELEKNNPMADDKSFTVEWVYGIAVKE